MDEDHYKQITIFLNNNASNPYRLGRRLFNPSIHPLTIAHKRKLEPFWREVEFSFNFKDPTTSLLCKWQLSEPKSHGKGFGRLYPKHAATLFKFALKALPLQDRFHAQLPFSPCPMCKQGPDDHQHVLACTITKEAWDITLTQCGL